MAAPVKLELKFQSARTLVPGASNKLGECVSN